MHDPKNGKGPFERVVDAISDFMSTPISDESNETPRAAEVKRGKASAMASGMPAKKRRTKAATKKRTTATKKRGASTKKRGASTKKRAGSTKKRAAATKKRTVSTRKRGAVKKKRGARK